ncbi:MAG: hypothetical protein ACI814_001323 [Mariniblastus sp.]|jgi:hypothetical protein
MHFCYHPENENGCGHPERCPHLDGAPLGFLVTLQTSGEESRMQLHKQVDVERKHVSELIGQKTRLEEELAQAKLELKLERQNKFSTNEQKNEDKDEPASELAAEDEPKKRGASVSHPGWNRLTPTQYDTLLEVPSLRYCPHCRGSISSPKSAAAVDHLQEDIIGISYRKILRIIEELHGISFTPAALIGFETMLADNAAPVVDEGIARDRLR